jgi:hypothetical protein
MSRALRRHYRKVKKAKKNRILKLHYRRSWPSRPWRPIGDICMTTPTWWTHFYMVRPARVDSNRKLHMIIRGADPDQFIFQNYRKPHWYYW